MLHSLVDGAPTKETWKFQKKLRMSNELANLKMKDASTNVQRSVGSAFQHAISLCVDVEIFQFPFIMKVAVAPACKKSCEVDVESSRQDFH